MTGVPPCLGRQFSMLSQPGSLQAAVLCAVSCRLQYRYTTCAHAHRMVVLAGVWQSCCVAACCTGSSGQCCAYHKLLVIQARAQNTKKHTWSTLVVLAVAFVFIVTGQVLGYPACRNSKSRCGVEEYMALRGVACIRRGSSIGYYWRLGFSFSMPLAALCQHA
jgi:hypothetical protein